MPEPRAQRSGRREPATSLGALTAYPLSEAYRSRLEARLGRVPEYTTLTELRQLSLPRMLATLRRSRVDRLLLPLEDASADGMLSVLGGLAAFTPAKRIELVNADLEFEPFGRGRALRSLLAVAGASLEGLIAAGLCRLQLGRLGARPRIAAGAAAAGEVFYLKTNLLKGVKAGGSIGHIAGVVNGFARRELPVVFFSADQPTMIDPAVRHERVDLPRAFGLPRDVNQYLYQRLFWRRVERYAERSAPRFVYQRLTIGNYAGVLLSRSSGAPLLIEYNGSEVWIARNWGYPLRFPGLAEAAESACLRHAHLVVTVSEVLRDELIERGVDPARIVTYPNCIDPSVFDPGRFPRQEREALRARYGIPPEAVVVTFIGTFGQWHGVEVFARALAQLVDDSREWLDRRRVRFLLVGDGLKRPQVDAILAPERYRRYFTMPGLVAQDQAPLHLAASDILVSPHVPNADGTPFFGSPTKLFEYMAMGKGIVASDLDQIGVVLAGSPHVDGLDPAGEPPATARALLTAPGDPRELAAGIRLLVEQPRWRERLGRQARELALARYTWADHVGAVLDGLERLSREPDAP